MINLDYLYDPAAAKPTFDKNYFVDKKLGFQVIENGTILPYKDNGRGALIGALGGIIDGDGNFIGSSHVIDFRKDGKYTPPSESIKHSSKTVVYIGYFYPVWGHVITDNICHLWFLRSDDFKSQFKDCPLVYISWSDLPLKNLESFKRLLEILELDVDKLQKIEQPTQFDKIILPDRSFFHVNKGFVNEYRETINCIRDFALKNRTPTSSKKIYYFHGQRGFGEERIAQYLKSKGYEIVSPEKLTLDEQLNLLINCESFASTLGSSSHNSIFLRDNTETIFIPRFVNAFYEHQLILDQIHEQNINFVDSALSIFHTRNGPFCYIVSEQLKRFFGDKWDGYEEGDFEAFLRYTKDSIARGLAANETGIKKYGAIFTDFMAQLKKREDLITAEDMPTNWETFQPMLTYQPNVHKKGWFPTTSFLPGKTLFYYQTYINKKDWGEWVGEDQISGSPKDELDIQMIKINFPDHKIYYSVYYNAEEGWSKKFTNSQQTGTTDETKAIYGVKIWLNEAGTKEFDVLYRVHKFDGNWTAWAKNGEAIYSHGQKLNAIQIKLGTKAVA